MECISAIGGYDEKLFIDSVDFDFSLRLLDRGYKLVKVANATANHVIGEGEEKRFLFFKVKYYTHSKERYYYISRNHFYILNKYKRHVMFCIKKRISFAIDMLRIIVVDDKRMEK